MIEDEFYCALSERRVRIITPDAHTAEIRIFREAADAAAWPSGRIANRDFIDLIPVFYEDDHEGYDSSGQIVWRLSDSQIA